MSRFRPPRLGPGPRAGPASGPAQAGFTGSVGVLLQAGFKFTGKFKFKPNLKFFRVGSPAAVADGLICTSESVFVRVMQVVL